VGWNRNEGQREVALLAGGGLHSGLLQAEQWWMEREAFSTARMVSTALNTTHISVVWHGMCIEHSVSHGAAASRHQERWSSVQIRPLLIDSIQID